MPGILVSEVGFGNLCMGTFLDFAEKGYASHYWDQEFYKKVLAEIMFIVCLQYKLSLHINLNVYILGLVSNLPMLLQVV